MVEAFQVAVSIALLTAGHVASALPAKAPWATVEQTDLSSRATSLMGP